jgi:hypothetical protein
MKFCNPQSRPVSIDLGNPTRKRLVLCPLGVKGTNEMYGTVELDKDSNLVKQLIKVKMITPCLADHVVLNKNHFDAIEAAGLSQASADRYTAKLPKVARRNHT